MKRNRTLFTLAAAALAFAVVSEALPGIPEGGHPFDVTVLYLVQDGDREDEDIPRARDAVVRARQLIAEEMERNGHGKGRTFNYNEGNGLGGFHVHYEKVKNVNFFETSDVSEIHNWAVGWIPEWWARRDKLNNLAHLDRTYLVLIEGARGIADGRTCGIAVPWAWEGFPPERYIHGGWAFVAMQSECANLSAVIAHELCHAFGLAHTTENAQYLMSHKGGAVGTRLLPEESNWLAGTRYFNRNHKAIVDGVGIEPTNMEPRIVNGEHYVRAHYDIVANEGAYMLQLRQANTLALVELNMWARTAAVDILREKIAEDVDIRWRTLSATGGFTWGRHPVELPATVNPKEGFSISLSWAEIKTQRQ